MNVPEKHRRKIAVSTLSMTPAAAKIMGGMTFEEAYEVVYNSSLKARLEQLVEEYGIEPEGFLSWELEKYGWDKPFELLCAIDPLAAEKYAPSTAQTTKIAT